MRTTAVPAQVTTVEDRIVGTLSLSQLLLICVPVFGGSLLYAALPPMMTISIAKVSVMLTLGIICGILAIRIKGMIVLSWVSILFHYWLRPRYYIFDKRSTHNREQNQSAHEQVEEEITIAHKEVRKAPALSIEDITKVREIIENPAANLAFETRKGGLYVRIREVKQES